jgi:hypothetical protein
MGRSAIGLCGFVGLTAGSFVPVLWGGSGLSLVSLLLACVGGIAGVWLGARICGV